MKIETNTKIKKPNKEIICRKYRDKKQEVSNPYKSWRQRISPRQYFIFIVLILIIAALSVFGIGFVGWNYIQLSLLIIPVSLGAFLDRYKMGIALALVMGLYTLMYEVFQNFIAINYMNFIFKNPIVAILPEVIGVAILSWVYSKLGIAYKWLRIIAAAFSGMAVYELCILLGAYVVGRPLFLSWTGLSISDFYNILIGVGFVQWGVLSLLVSLVSIPIVYVVDYKWPKS